jgi:hypothetical protein
MHPRLRRALAGAAVGTGLVLVWRLIFRLAPNWPPRIGRGDQCRDFGCALGAALTSLVLTLAVVIASSMVVGWVVLRAIRVRPAWPVAILGPVLGWAILALAGQAQSGSVGWLVPGMAVGYGLAGLISAPRAA